MVETKESHQLNPLGVQEQELQPVSHQANLTSSCPGTHESLAKGGRRLSSAGCREAAGTRPESSQPQQPTGHVQSTLSPAPAMREQSTELVKSLLHGRNPTQFPNQLLDMWWSGHPWGLVPKSRFCA